MIRQPLPAPQTQQLPQVVVRKSHTPLQEQVVRGASSTIAKQVSRPSSLSITSQPKSQMTQKFDKLINSARLLLNDSSNKVASVKNKTQMLNATEKIVETLEQSVEQLQQTLAMLDGIKCNEEERLERATIMYRDAEKLVTECEGVMKELIDVQERAKEYRQSFALETGELYNKFHKFEQYVHKIRDERDAREGELQSEYKKRDDINKDIANIIECINAQKNILEETKKEGVVLDEQYLVLVNTRQECINNLQVKVQQTEDLKKRCTELYEEIDSINECIVREEEELKKHLSCIEKINEANAQLNELRELASSLETIALLPRKVAELFHRLDVVYQISTDEFSQFVSGLDKRIGLVLEAHDSVNEKERQLEGEREKLMEVNQRYENMRQELISLQNEHYLLIEKTREIEKSNAVIREERDNMFKKVEHQQEQLIVEGQKLQAVKTEIFHMEKSMKKRKSEFLAQKEKLEMECTKLERDREDIDRQLMDINAKKNEQAEKLKLLEEQHASLIAENESLDIQLVQNKEKEQSHVNTKREELDRLIQVLQTEKEKKHKLMEEVKLLEKQFEELSHKKEQIINRESVEQEIKEYDRSLHSELKKEIEKIQQQQMLEAQREEEELRKMHHAKVSALDHMKAEALAKFTEEEKRLLEIHNQKIRELTGKGETLILTSQSLMLPPSPVTPNQVRKKASQQHLTSVNEHEYSIDFNTQPQEDEDDLFASPIRTQQTPSKGSKTPTTATKKSEDETIVNSSQKKRFARRQLSITKVTATEETTESWFNE